MGLRAAEDTGSRFVAFVDGLCERDRSCGSGGTATGLLHGFGDAVRAEECGADGGGDGSGKRWGAASVATAFRRRGALVGRESLGQSTRDGAVGGAPWADRCVDH